MAISIKHTKVSTIPDGADTDLVRPSDWNSEHTISGVAASGANSDITSLSGITGAISTPDYIAFDTAYATTLAAGQLGWDGNNTLGLGMIGGNVIQHIGEDQFFYCKASSAITKGQVVMFTGAVGASGVPTGAPATGITDGTYIMGVAAESIALNGFGLIQSFGTLRNVNTSGYADGDILWYDPAVTGGLTKTKPSAPNVKAQMAAVINGGSSGGGTILIRIDPGSTLGGTDSNAQITSPTAAQIITYASADGYWKNTSLTAGTGISINNATTGVVTVTNSAPDQTVAISAGTGISVTGTYPNFTVTNTSPSSGGTVTSVTGTAPISSSGGNTPAISISQATTSTDGYLSSTDWNTFNNKQPAGSYLTSVTADSPLSGSGTSSSHLVIAQATTSTSGYLSSTDWNTFNNKGSGTVTSVSGTSPISVATGTTTPAISISQATTSTNGYLSSTDWNTFNNKVSMVYPGAGIPNSTGSAWGTSYSTSGSGTVVALTTSPSFTTPVLGTPTSGNLSNCTSDGTNKVGYRNVPAVGTKTSSYSLTTSDVGKYVQVGSGGSITIPDATFAEGDIISVFNNTSGNITITCSITTAYISGTDADKATMTLATRGVATILFISGTVCVVSGNVS